MVAPVTVGETDWRTLLGIVACEREDLPPYGLPLSLLTDLMGQIRCDAMTLVGHDSGQQEQWFWQEFPADDADPADWQQMYWEQFWNCEACCYPDRSGDLRSVTKVSDFYSARRWHSTGMYADCFRPDWNRA